MQSSNTTLVSVSFELLYNSVNDGSISAFRRCSSRCSLEPNIVYDDARTYLPCSACIESTRLFRCKHEPRMHVRRLCGVAPEHIATSVLLLFWLLCDIAIALMDSGNCYFPYVDIEFGSWKRASEKKRKAT